MSKKFTEELAQEIIAFYQYPHSAIETINTFASKGLTKYLLNVLLKNYNIQKHDRELSYVFLRETSLAKYGTDWPAKAKVVREKVVDTCLERYGCTSPLGNQEVQLKSKQTCLANYGVEHQSQASVLRERAKQTCLEKYGVENPFQAEEIKQRIIQTNNERYGTDFAIMRKDFIERARATRAERYENGWYDPAKLRQTCEAKYGVSWYSQTVDFHKQGRKKYYFEDETFDSLPELAVWVYHIKHNIPIKRHPFRFNYEVSGKRHYYFPDFEIDGGLVEIKGDQFFKEDGTMCNPFDHEQDNLYEAKHQCMLQHNVVIWKSADYSKYLEWFNSNYDKTEFNCDNLQPDF